MLYDANTLCMLSCQFPFVFPQFPVILSTALKKHPFVVYKKQTANVAINSQKQQPSLSPFAGKAAMAIGTGN